MAHRFRKSRIRILEKMGAFRRINSIISNAGGELDPFLKGVPFQLLDTAIASQRLERLAFVELMADRLPGNQPILLRAIIKAYSDDDGSGLLDLAFDDDLHPLTRFEAIGWTNFFKYNKTSWVQNSKPNRVPPSIFQFWDNKLAPPEIERGILKWQKISKHAHYRFNDESAQQFIASHFGKEAARQYCTLWHPALKSDLFRLYYLAEKGGIYVDADSEPKKHASRICNLSGGSVLLTSMSRLPNCATINGLIAAPAQHSFVVGFLEQVRKNLADEEHRKIFWLSGPGALTLYLFKHGGDVRLLSQGQARAQFFQQFDAPYKLTNRNWRVFEHMSGDREEDVLANQIQKVVARGE